EIGTDYETSSREWYHLLFNEEDFSLLIAVPNIKWYAICRCHLVADDDILDCEERTPSYDIWHACELLEVMKRQNYLD
ncbi:MAG TPA: hypothetical protein VJ279_13100, partial [Hanamia sp.]|nr:hypothetical protein [Hanamia sp.]